MTQVITEEMHVHDAWYEEASKMTMAELPEFLRKLTEEYGHDYGTIVHAIASAAVAAAWSVERTPVGGITGFQASAVMWQFIKHWMHNDNPLRLMDYDDMLYPQYHYRFTTISPQTFKWLQEQAQAKIDDEEQHRYAHRDVVAHWHKIVSGEVPFGYTLEAE